MLVRAHQAQRLFDAAVVVELQVVVQHACEPLYGNSLPILEIEELVLQPTEEALADAIDRARPDRPWGRLAASATPLRCKINFDYLARAGHGLNAYPIARAI